MSQKGFASVLIIIVGVVVLAGIAGYFVLNQRAITSPALTPTSTPPTSTFTTPTLSPTPSHTPTPTPAKKVDLRSSLLTITDRHLRDAEVIATGVKLFEVETSISPEEINSGDILIQHVFSSFALPNTDVKYIRVNEWFDNQAKRNYTTSSESFVVQTCSGGAAPPPGSDCGQPTGESEPREKHLPINDWNIDSQALGRILKESGMGSSRGGKIIVTTIYRLRSEYSDFFLQSLAGFPDGQTVIGFIETGTSGAATNFSEVGQYVVLDTEKGKVLARGDYKLPPPAP